MNSCGKPNFPERENQSKNEGSEFANFPIGKFSPFTSRRGMQFPEQENNRQIVLEIIGFRIAQIDAALPCLRSRQTISFRVPTDHRPLGGSRSCWLQFASVRKTRKSCILNPLKGGAVAMKCSSTGDIQRAAISEPVIITNHGCPKACYFDGRSIRSPQGRERRTRPRRIASGVQSQRPTRTAGGPSRLRYERHNGLC